MRIALFAAALTLCATGVAGAAEDGPIRAGYWESTSRMLSPFTDSKTERKCISAAQINSYLTGPSNPHYSCRYDEKDVHDGHARMQGECIDNNGLHSNITVEGEYTAESFNLKGHARLSLGGLKIPVETSIDAHRLSDECPIGAKVEGGPPRDN